MPTVNPSEAECLLHGIKIPEMLVIYRSSPFHVNPAFSFAGVVGFEPCTELTSVGYTEDVMLFHKFRFIWLQRYTKSTDLLLKSMLNYLYIPCFANISGF